MTSEQQSDNIDEAVADDEPQYGVGPFTIREVALVGTWLVAFVVSFFPIYGDLGRDPSVWASGIDWVLTIGVPTVAVFLVVLRRLSPQGIRRVGSLAIDQFASVAFSVATVLWLTILWNSFITLADRGFFPASWVVWVEFFLLLAGVVLTVFAPLIAPFAQDFRGRPEVPAHRNARPVRRVSPRPVAVRPEPADDAEAAPAGEPAVGEPAAGEPAAGESAAEEVPATTADDFATTVIPVERASGEAAVLVDDPSPAVEPAEATEATPTEATPVAAPQTQAFWALAPEDRDIVDEIGIPVFRIGPTAWALVIEDRGEVFVVRHEDGRIGYLHDVSGVTRG